MDGGGALLTSSQLLWDEPEREENMTIFITMGRFSKDGMAGLLARPEDRTKAVSELFTGVGGHLIDLYFTLGDYDVVVISECPDEKAALAALLPVAASGVLSDLRTCVAYRPADAAAAAQKAKSVTYRPPGRA